MNVIKSAGVAAVFGVLLAAPAALADANISAAPPDQYVNSDVTIDQGGTVTFTNNDTVEHDVTARDNGPDGKPLFQSPLTSSGQTTTVKGTQYLTTGSYAFVCSIHPNMTGTIHVTSNGTPVPRPSSGGGGGGSSSGGGGGGSSSRPSATLRVLDARLSAVRRRGALRVRVTLDRAATVKVTARSGHTTLGAATVKATKAGARTVTLKLTPAGRRLVRGRSRLAITVTSGTARAKATLRR